MFPLLFVTAIGKTTHLTWFLIPSPFALSLSLSLFFLYSPPPLSLPFKCKVTTSYKLKTALGSDTRQKLLGIKGVLLLSCFFSPFLSPLNRKTLQKTDKTKQVNTKNKSETSATKREKKIQKR